MIIKNLVFFFKIFVSHRLAKIYQKLIISNKYEILVNRSLHNLRKKNYFKKFKNHKSNKRYTIELASKRIRIKKIEWTKFYEDNEDIDSLYRFNWIIKVVINQGLINKKFQFWINNQIHELISVSKKKNLDNFSKICFHPYNISERLSNLITYYILYKKNLTKESYDFIITDIQTLLNNLEINGHRTGNHIVNNCRALIYSGYFLNNKKLIEIGVNIFLEKYKKILFDDGFLRDGSTHYHFLVTRWIFEINSLLNKSKYKSYRVKKIDKICREMIKICNYFNDKSIDLFPLFGDISPDFSPSYFNNLFDKKNKPKKNFLSIWRKLRFKNVNENISNDKVLDIKKKSGWLKLKILRYVVFLRLPISNKDLSHNLIHHSHDDVGHFLIYYNKKAIFSKSGRYTYNNLQGTRNIDHNKIYLINRKSKNFRLFILSFFNNHLDYNLKRKKNYYEFSILNNDFFKWKRKIIFFNSKIKIIDKNLSFFNLNLIYHLNHLRDKQIECDSQIKYKSNLVKSYGKKDNQKMLKFLLKPKYSKNLTIKL